MKGSFHKSIEYEQNKNNLQKIIIAATKNKLNTRNRPNI